MPLPESAAPPDVAVEERVVCDEQAAFPVSASRLSPAVAVDYLALRSAGGTPAEGSADDWTRKDFDVMSQIGTPCEGAPPGSPCAEKVMGHPVAPVNAQCVQLCREVSLVTTRTAEVERWATPAQLRELLVPINTVDEALLLVHAENYDISCASESTKVRRTPTGYEVFATRMTSSCAPIITTGYWLRVTAAGEVTPLASKELSRSEACVGRRPAGLVSFGASERGEQRGESCSAQAASYLAECAYLEAASVVSFERLARALRALGAPEALVAEAYAARDDELRHAEVIGNLSQARGGILRSLRAAESGDVGLEALALENAVEGCVRETYGAMVGAFQALRAEDAELRAAMGPIADDELRHAALSHRVHVWAMGALSQQARGRVHAALSEAVAQLCEEPREHDAGPAHRQLGLPSGHEAVAMLNQLKRDLWQPMLA